MMGFKGDFTVSLDVRLQLSHLVAWHQQPHIMLNLDLYCFHLAWSVLLHLITEDRLQHSDLASHTQLASSPFLPTQTYGWNIYEEDVPLVPPYLLPEQTKFHSSEVRTITLPLLGNYKMEMSGNGWGIKRLGVFNTQPQMGTVCRLFHKTFFIKTNHKVDPHENFIC